MQLVPGIRLGAYEIVGLLGVGGMGEVYRAVDTRLDRQVALKVLPEAVATDPERTARFHREAKVLASLNHPHIAALFGLEEAGGRHFLTMELVEGETLADRIARGPIPVDETLPIAKQIAEALEAAHEQGIIHRDLKPANVKVRPDGTVKVLDFGLAKALAPQGAASSHLSNSPTVTRPVSMTGKGILLGTAPYMSPEQARGKAVDKRADIWAYGCVLYEMLTGERPFGGEDVSETLAAVLKSSPDLTRIPPVVSGLVAACLEKDSKQRLRDIGDAPRLITQDALSRTGGGRQLGLTAAVLVALLAAATVAMVWRRAPASPDRPLMRLDLNLGGNAMAVGTNDVVISPDGTRVVFSIRSASGGSSQLATRRLDATVATPLPGTEASRFVFFSPDSRSVGFFADGKLKTISLDGGAAVVRADAPAPLGGSWGDDGYIVAADATRGLVRISEKAGDTQVLTQNIGGETYVLPQVLPGGQSVVFTARSVRWAESSVEAFVVGTQERKKLVARGYFGHYVPSGTSTGHLLYVSDGALLAAAFDPARLELLSQPVRMLDGVGGTQPQRSGSISSSANGTFVYRSELLLTMTSRVMSLESSGKTEPILPTPGVYYNPYLSPDGQRLAVTVGSELGTGGELFGDVRDVWVHEPNRDMTTRITRDGVSQLQSTVWTPDGRHVVIWRQSANGYAIAFVRADGSGTPVVLHESKNIIVPTSFSPDGGRLLYFEIDPRSRQDLWVLPVDFSDAEHPKAGKPEPFLRTDVAEFEATFSPDGRWVAYRSETDVANSAIFVRPYPGSGDQVKISTGSGLDRNPMWSPNRKELFYVSGDGHIMVVEYAPAGDSFGAGRPRVWGDYRTLGLPAAYDVTLRPDGKGFVVLVAAQTTTQNDSGPVRATFLLNFFDELRRRVPAK